MEKIKKNHSICSIGYHLIWTTKFRHQILKNAVEIETKKIFAEVCIQYEWLLRTIEVMPDHVHLFVQTDHLTRPVDIVKTIKSISAVHLFHRFPDLKKQKFWGSGLWSDGTYYSTVGHISEETVQKYISNQKNGSHPHP